MSDSLWPHGLQHIRLPCPSLCPRACPNSCPLNQWCLPTISSSAVPFSFCPQSFSASWSFPRSFRFSTRVFYYLNDLNYLIMYILNEHTQKLWSRWVMSTLAEDRHSKKLKTRCEQEAGSLEAVLRGRVWGSATQGHQPWDRLWKQLREPCTWLSVLSGPASCGHVPSNPTRQVSFWWIK